jgi:hypothetical protein
VKSILVGMLGAALGYLARRWIRAALRAIFGR